MLGAYFFTLTAADTFAGLAIVHGMYVAVVIVRIPVMEDRLGIHAGEQIRNGDLLRASLDAVTACGTGNHVLGMEDIGDSLDCCHLGLIQRLEILHVA